MAEGIWERIKENVGEAVTGAGKQLARVPGTVADVAMQTLRLPRTLMEQAGYAPHEIEATMGQLGLVPQVPPGIKTAA